MTRLPRGSRLFAMLDLFLVAGEESGDHLGASLMRALQERTRGEVRFAGVGGREMTKEGIASLHPIDNLSIIGFSSIPHRLPRVFRLVRLTAKEVIARSPDALIIIDSPGFTHPIARRVRAAAPKIPIVDYVSPSVWAWRPGRAKAMRTYVDHVLAVMPFEPEVLQQLGGPPCTYVGHPLAEKAPRLRPNAQEACRRLASPPVLLVLPGSRTGEIRRLLAVFSAAVSGIRNRLSALEVVIPTVPPLVEMIRQASAQWTQPPRIIVEPAEKEAAFRIARAALTKSGTVTLELALAGVPMVAAYKVSALEYLAVGRAIEKRLSSIILVNLFLGENVIPELLQRRCTPDELADAMIPLFDDTPQRRRQVEAFGRLDAVMRTGSSMPAARAAEAVLELLKRG
jgi:lipid-A-disaccharide synthase